MQKIFDLIPAGFGIALLGMFILSACSEDIEQLDPQLITEKPPSEAETETASREEFSFEREDTRYLFDATTHTVDELLSLLSRAEEIITTNPGNYEDMDIVLILHGPDINLFRRKNYNENKELVDLAAKLDAFRIIDMKICETAMSKMGVDISEVPPFIEPVPFAPAEIERLTNEGYFNL